MSLTVKHKARREKGVKCLEEFPLILIVKVQSKKLMNLQRNHKFREDWWELYLTVGTVKLKEGKTGSLH